MSFATSNRTGLHYVAESVIGTTPATPALVELRYTGEGINFSVDTVVSDEIRSDRQITDLVPVSQTSSGNVDFELSFSEFDQFLEGALFSDFSSAQVLLDAATTISTDVDGILDSANNLGGFVVGQWVKAQGFTDPLNNIVYRVVTASAGEITVSPAPNSAEVAGAAVTLTGQMLRNGTTAKSFTIQKRFNDATVVEYNNFTGMHVNGLSLNFENGAILGGSMDFIGLSGALTSTQFSGATNVGATTNDVMNSVSNLKNIEIDDVDAADCSIVSMTVDVANNLRTQNAIGSLASCGIGVGRFEVTGSISLFFQDEVEYNKYTANTAFKLSMRAEDSTGKAYVFTFPRVKYESMTLVSGGTDSDIMLEGSFRALRDSVSDSMMQIDRLSLANTDAAV